MNESEFLFQELKTLREQVKKQDNDFLSFNKILTELKKNLTSEIKTIESSVKTAGNRAELAKTEMELVKQKSENIVTDAKEYTSEKVTELFDKIDKLQKYSLEDAKEYTSEKVTGLFDKIDKLQKYFLENSDKINNDIIEVRAAIPGTEIADIETKLGMIQVRISKNEAELQKANEAIIQIVKRIKDIGVQEFFIGSGGGESGGGGGGLASVSSDSTLTGDGTSGDPLKVANEFTSADETKLDGIETGAQKNPKNFIPILRFQDGNPDNVIAGEVSFIKSDNTQWQSGSSTQIAAIEISDKLCSATQNPLVDTATSTGHHNYLNDRVQNGGQVIITFARLLYSNNNVSGVSSTQVIVIRTENVSINDDNNYVLSNLTHLLGFSQSGEGYGWQLRSLQNPLHLPSDIIGDFPYDRVSGVPDFVKKSDLKGKETDRYASYNNAALGANYWDGTFCIFDQDTGAPQTANAVGQPDIGDDTTVVIAVGAKLRTDRDPNNAVFAAANVATDYVSGDIINFSIWDDSEVSMRATLTSGGTLVGTGSAAYIWFTASLDEIKDVSNVTNYGNYFLISDEEPSQLPIEIPYTDVLGIFHPTGTSRNDGNIDNDTKLLLDSGDDLKIGELVEYHDEHHVGTFEVTGLSYNTSANIDTFEVNDVNFTVDLDPTKGVIYYKYADTAARDSFKPKIILGRYFELKLSDSIKITAIIESTPSDLNGRLSFNLNSVVETGTRTNNHTAEIIVDSNIPARIQIPSQAFIASAINIAGKGSSNGNEWISDGTSTGGSWGNIMDVYYFTSGSGSTTNVTLASAKYPVKSSASNLIQSTATGKMITRGAYSVTINNQNVSGHYYQIPKPGIYEIEFWAGYHGFPNVATTEKTITVRMASITTTPSITSGSEVGLEASYERGSPKLKCHIKITSSSGARIWCLLETSSNTNLQVVGGSVGIKRLKH